MVRIDSSLLPNFDFEREALTRGFARVAGIDEAGRGPWAGPVVAAAVILDPDDLPDGLNDSKKLTHARRAELHDIILAKAEVGIGIVDVAVIDRDNILQATYAAMIQAVAALASAPLFALVDGNRAPKLACPVETVIEGDGKCLSIAAASIIAKVTRDRMMVDLDQQYPGYGFAKHKGYGTAEHQEALARLGPTTHHRRSFEPIRVLFETATASL
ncbi:ribonuclease HII [Taklimakanibacter albus]|uniref:Ribonuclease HII n=1 Tax=Taklimakanibacter albus TaxID=2800327 RepID=A0ACC5RCS4_9HYPH|nr:ribonuclease HII [Aestuariivirga sp. YIM B02566]MBK1870405.1 ribonuclease HII [Aestuariivirga sp. YIM B02566]